MPKQRRNLITAVEISQKFHISYQLVNYYTNIGLFSICANDGNRRLYDSGKVEAALKKIKDLRSRGYPLRIIRDELLNNSA